MTDVKVTLESTLERDWMAVCRDVVDGCHVAVRDGVTVGAAQARIAHKYKSRSGKLTRSTKGYVARDTRLGTEGVLEAAEKYASFVEKGTRAHPIDPVHAKVLRWEDDEGGVHYAPHVDHPGTRAMPFLEPTIPLMERTMARHIEFAIVRAERRFR